MPVCLENNNPWTSPPTPIIDLGMGGGPKTSNNLSMIGQSSLTGDTIKLITGVHITWPQVWLGKLRKYADMLVEINSTLWLRNIHVSSL